MSPNKLIILDDSLDRLYDKVSIACKSYGFPLFMIKLQVPQEIAVKRIIERETVPQNYLQHMDKWFHDYQQFDAHCIQYTFDNSQEITNSAIDTLVACIQEKIKSPFL